MAEISIKEALELPPNEACKQTLHVMVLEKGNSKIYKDSKTVCEVIVSDGVDVVRVFIYAEHLLQLFNVGGGILLSDFIVKPGFFVVTTMTDVFAGCNLTMDPSMWEKAQDLFGHVMTVNEAATSPKKTPVKSVEGIIVKTSEIQTKRKRTTNEEILFKRARLRDESGTIELCLWRQMANTAISKGDVVRCLKFEVSDCLDANNKSVPALVNKNAAVAIEMLPKSETLEKLIDLPEDLLEDDGVEIVASTIIGFGPINVHQSCPNEACFKKKVSANFKCPKCGVTYSAETVGKSINAQMRVQGLNLNKFSYFSQQAVQLKEHFQIDTNITDPTFLTELTKHLPIRVKLQTKDTKVTSIKFVQ